MTDKPSPIFNAETVEAWIREITSDPTMMPKWEDWLDLLLKLREYQMSDAVRGTKGREGLLASFASINSILGFLSKQKYFMKHPEALEPLSRLVGSVRTLAMDGHLSPLFKPRRIGGAPGDVGNEGLLKGLAVQTMTELMAAGAKAPDAAERVAKALSKATFSSGKPVTAKMVKYWRERVMRTKHGNVSGVSPAFEFAYWNPMGPEYGVTPAERAECLLDEIRAMSAGGM